MQADVLILMCRWWHSQLWQQCVISIRLALFIRSALKVCHVIILHSYFVYLML